LYINKLTLIYFRNYREAHLEPHSELNVIFGANAQGKSNLLEALFLFTTGKSFRAGKEIELVNWEENFSRVAAEITYIHGEKINIEILISKNSAKTSSKIIKLNNKTVRTATELVGTVNAVMFSPDDLEIIKGSPGVRRRFIDMELTQLSPSYCDNLRLYYKVLEQRNTLLRSALDKEEKIKLLNVWDEQLAKYGSFLISRRVEIIKKLEELAQIILRDISNNRENLSLEYFSTIQGNDFSSIEENFLGHLCSMMNQDIRYGSTSAGPHRDDIKIFLNEKPLRTFGSQGQQRTVTVALKLAERELLFNETGEHPVVLLDDVMSELDKDRTFSLLNYIKGKGQIFITLNHIKDFFDTTSKEASFFQIKEGKITGGLFN
jgi:DNA replication and repair protein RecF